MPRSWSMSPSGSDILSSTSLSFHVKENFLFLRYGYFKTLILKIQNQGHEWGQSSRSHGRSNILSTDIPLVPCQLVLPFLRYCYFEIWPWKSKLKVIIQSHIAGPTAYQLTPLLFCVNRPSHYRYMAISQCLKLMVAPGNPKLGWTSEIWPWASKNYDTL